MSTHIFTPVKEAVEVSTQSLAEKIPAIVITDEVLRFLREEHDLTLTPEMVQGILSEHVVTKALSEAVAHEIVNERGVAFGDGHGYMYGLTAAPLYLSEWREKWQSTNRKIPLPEGFTNWAEYWG